MIRNFLFRILITLYCVIGFLLYLVTVVFCWVFSISMIIVLTPIAWLLFGSIGIDTVFKIINLDTYREMVGFGKEDDAFITPLWFFYIFDKLKEIYNSNNTCNFK